MQDVIARRELVAVWPSGERISFVIEIGRPYPFDDPKDDWKCPVAITLWDHRTEIGGVDALQALCLAIRHARFLLTDFVDQGGKLLYPDSEDEFDLQTASFS